MKTIRIGGGQGFWGDSNDAAIHMVKKGDLHYLACDYLAELTLSIMQRQRQRNPEKGFAHDFIIMLRDILKESLIKNVKILSNAGGMNVTGAVNEIVKLAAKLQVKDFKIGYVLGDDLLDDLQKLQSNGVALKNFDDGRDFAEIKDKVVNANVYYGHEPIKKCLEMGAHIVITGRATDSSLFLAPLAHEFGWKTDEWSKLARGIIVGHLLECGGQGSGGNFDYGWRSVPGLEELGYPIAAVRDTDEIVITKAPDCGGLISVETCKEQLLYEIHDPANYITPDVVVDISQAKLTGIEKNRVRLEDVSGKPRPDQLKLCIGYLAGYKIEGYLPFSWPDALDKAKAAAEIILKRLEKKGLKANRVRVDYLGVNALHGPVAPPPSGELNEVVLRIAIQTDDKKEAEKLAPEFSPIILNGPPGSCFFGGRPKATEIIALWPTLIPRESVELTSHVFEVK
ncbi:MAG: DUF1446 domain-containing protein [Deltaproteobacteria bacterium]|nr:DUF1446 domain-containing protein [Deltaproteobacteria bacterium]